MHFSDAFGAKLCIPSKLAKQAASGIVIGIVAYEHLGALAVKVRNIVAYTVSSDVQQLGALKQ